MNIGFTFNVRHVKPDINNPKYIAEAEFDEPATIRGIEKTLQELGHKVFKIAADETAYLKLKKIKNKIALVFNIAEGARGADREAQLPAMMEMLGIPYTGPKPLAYALELNKAKAKEIFLANNIPTPAWRVINTANDQVKWPFTYPAIVKPIGEGSSKGIMAKNFVKNFSELKKITSELLKKFEQPALIEEYLPGREFTVAMIGEPLRPLPIIEITFQELPKGMPKFDHFEAKWLYDNPQKGVDPLICPAKTSRHLKKQIEQVSLNACQALEMTDFARVDIRLDKKGIPNVIEINCPPGIIPDPTENSRFPRAARAAGIDYNKMIEIILRSACKRYGIKYSSK